MEEKMVVGVGKIYLRADWVSSLKEKRMVVRSIIDKVKHKFHISIAEVIDMDVHQTIVLGIVCVSNEVSHANSVLDTVIHFIEKNTEAEIWNTELEILHI